MLNQGGLSCRTSSTIISLILRIKDFQIQDHTLNYCCDSKSET